MKIRCTREYARGGMVDLEWVQSRSQLADILAKRSGKPSVKTFVPAVLHRGKYGYAELNRRGNVQY